MTERPYLRWYVAVLVGRHLSYLLILLGFALTFAPVGDTGNSIGMLLVGLGFALWFVLVSVVSPLVVHQSVGSGWLGTQRWSLANYRFRSHAFIEQAQHAGVFGGTVRREAVRRVMAVELLLLGLGILAFFAG